jgi:hypothetical protein
MNSKITLFLFGLGTLLILTSGIHSKRSSAAPIGSTAAPGEETCGRAGCHTGNNGSNNINTGSGILSISSNKNLQFYVPGESYEITVRIEESNIERFGFSLTVLDENNNKAGHLSVTNHQLTQILDGINQFAGRQYITYRMKGTEPYESGVGQWTFNWTAPETNVGKISFFTAGVSGDNDGTDLGDLVYTHKIEASYSLTSVSNLEKKNSNVSVYPIPAKEFIHIQVEHFDHSNLKYSLFDIKGINVLQTQNDALLNPTSQMNISNLNSGIYFLHIVSDNETIHKQIIIKE